MRAVWIIAARDIRESLRARSFWVTIAVLLLGVAAAVVLPRVLDGGDDPSTVAIAGEGPAGLRQQLDALAEAYDEELEVERVPGLAAAERLVRDEDATAALVFDADGAAVVRRDGSSETVVALLGQAAAGAATRERLAGAGLSPAEVSAALDAPPPADVVVDEAGADRGGVAYVVALALYLTILMGGMGVATGVAVEKSTHVAELLVTMVRPTQLLAGKVIGVGISTLLLLLGGAVPLLVAVLAGWVDAPTAAAADIVGGIGWFLLGYGVYAVAYAAMGALIDRQEDLSGAVSPLTTALVLAFFAGIQALGSPDSTLARVTSFIPLSSPIVMPVRIARESASPVEVAIAVGLALVTIAVLTRLGGTVYRRALLRGGRRLKLAEVLRAG